MFRIDSLNKKETEIGSNCVGFRPSVVVMLQPAVHTKYVWRHVAAGAAEGNNMYRI